MKYTYAFVAFGHCPYQSERGTVVTADQPDAADSVVAPEDQLQGAANADVVSGAASDASTQTSDESAAQEDGGADASAASEGE